MKRQAEYRKRQGGYYHHRCGGQIWIEATGYRTLPLGFGFLPGDSRFSVATVRVPLVKGGCEKCHYEGEYTGKVRKHVYTKYPDIGKKTEGGRLQ